MAQELRAVLVDCGDISRIKSLAMVSGAVESVELGKPVEVRP